MSQPSCTSLLSDCSVLNSSPPDPRKKKKMRLDAKTWLQTQLMTCLISLQSVQPLPSTTPRTPPSPRNLLHTICCTLTFSLKSKWAFRRHKWDDSSLYVWLKLTKASHSVCIRAWTNIPPYFLGIVMYGLYCWVGHVLNNNYAVPK